MVLPEALLKSLQGIQGFDEEAFTNVHHSGEQITSIRINPAKLPSVNNQSTNAVIQHTTFNIQNPVPWSQFGFYLNQRPSFTFDPLFHAGCYYVQEASSMFLEQALMQTVDLSQSVNVLDLCAAPGGKSTHLQTLLSADSLLVSNDVIKSRSGTLKQNIIKWGSSNVIVTNNDPQHFKKLEGFFDVLVVDAPCSGSGLFRRDEEAINEWSLENVQLCCGRQQRILADVLPSLKEKGMLIYSTCSYSKEENEDILDWLVQEMNMENISLAVAPSWGIVESHSEKKGAVGYRFYPDKVKGEGFFISCFRKKATATVKKYKPGKWDKISAKEKELILPWIDKTCTDRLLFLKHEPFVFAWPEALAEDLSVVQSALYIQYAGTRMGELMSRKLVPDHAVAMSSLAGADIPKVELDYDAAIRYLQKREISVSTDKGWQLVTYKNYNLGWINALSSRINNYYPRDLRILRDRKDSSFEK